MRVFSAEITGKTDEEKNTPLQNLQYQTYGKTLTKSGSKDGVRSMAMSLRTRWVCAGVALLTVGGITGCTTTDPFALKIKADLERTPAPLGQKKYALIYGNLDSEIFILPHSELRLHATLRQLGYESADYQDVNVVIYVLAYKDQLGTVLRQMKIRDVAGAMNPDSIRYKNLAAMRDKGRYRELIDDDPYAPGDVVMGPSGEIILTGALKRQQMERDLPMKVVGQRINRLVIRALEAPIPTDPEDVKIRWRVDVVSELPLYKPAPPMEKLVEAALDHLLKKHPKPAAAQP